MEEYVYRFRESKKHNIKALENNYINGSLYRSFERCGELNFNISPDLIKRYHVTDSERKRLIEALKNNAYNNYYLASFTLNKPNIGRDEWKEYANNDGFCLEYRVQDIRDAMALRFSGDNIITNFDAVRYSNTSYELAPLFLKTLRQTSKKDKEYTEEEIKEMLYNHNKIYCGKYVVKSFYLKASSHRKYREVRLTMQGIERTNCKQFINKMIVVKPTRIIINKTIKCTHLFEIFEIARKNNIEVICLDEINTKYKQS